MSLRPWQADALACWKAAGRRGTVEVVTGAGKTVFALACLLDQLGSDDRARALIVVPTVQLLEQWRVAIETLTTVPRAFVTLIGGGHHGRHDRRVMLAVMNSARRLPRSLFKGGHWALIADECHHLGSTENAGILELTEYVATLGLSATPSRQYDAGFESVIAPGLGEVIYRLNYDAAIAAGLLVPFELWNVHVPMTPAESAEATRLDRAIAAVSRRAKERVEDKQRLKALLMKRKRFSHALLSRIPAAVGLMKSLRGRPTLVFHESIELAERLLSDLRADGHRARLYHSRMSAEGRYESLLLFQSGQIDVLVTCRALDEGFDVPAAEAALLVAWTNSDRQRIQRIGRVLRPAREKSAAVVATLYALDSEAQLLLREREAAPEVRQIRWMEAVNR